MKTYRGVVRGGVVELSEPVALEDGIEVEVHVVDVDDIEETDVAREEEFLQYLLETGQIERLPLREPPPGALDWTPITISGPPLSQTIIEDRR